ncbi:hypothetical protein [Luteimonas sp. FCS-9]|uniref:hypothetical protein n=1 Tax=Luteimonas sp. FCS-9 TaxID=1547516 RepID=UPI000A8F8D24|nr:hypothetical protein [Luteimonas sp. FCS-9]
MTRMHAIVHAAAARLAPMSALPRGDARPEGASRRTGAGLRGRDAGSLPTRFRFA